MNLQKPKPIKSKQIRQSAKDEFCTIRETGCQGSQTVVFAHINSPYKGMGNKSPDLFGCYSCHICHVLLDSGKVSYQDQLRALQETQLKLYDKGLIQVK